MENYNLYRIFSDNRTLNDKIRIMNHDVVRHNKFVNAIFNLILFISNCFSTFRTLFFIEIIYVLMCLTIYFIKKLFLIDDRKYIALVIFQY